MADVQVGCMLTRNPLDAEMALLTSVVPATVPGS